RAERQGLERQLAVAKYSGRTQGTIPTAPRQPSSGGVDDCREMLSSEPVRDAAIELGETYAFVRRIPGEQFVPAVAAENYRHVFAGELRYVIRRQRGRIAKRLL